MHRWGYAPTIDVLSGQLLGGSVPTRLLEDALAPADDVVVANGFVCLRGNETLLEKSRTRTASHGQLQGVARGIAEEYARDLARHCGFVECIALSGSVASGGFAAGDDIDFDLFVRSGTKYICYLAANLLGLKYAWRYRRVESDPLHRLPFLPKITCTNVVWPADQTRPFVRQDAGLAFELMRCIPLVGAARFEEVLRDNPWLRIYLPQILHRRYTDAEPVRPSGLSGLLVGLARRPWRLRFLERACRRVSWILYRFVQSTRQRNPRARERMEFLRRVKFPYEVFQD